MAYENIFLGSIEYSNQLQAEERRGRLQAETVSADTRAAIRIVVKI